MYQSKIELQIHSYTSGEYGKQQISVYDCFLVSEPSAELAQILLRSLAKCSPSLNAVEYQAKSLNCT
jgi:hypothetical protein